MSTCLVACLFGLHRFLECHADQFLVFLLVALGRAVDGRQSPWTRCCVESCGAVAGASCPSEDYLQRRYLLFLWFHFSNGIHLVVVVWHFTCGLAWSASWSVTLRTLLSFIFPAGSPFTRKFCHCCHRRSHKDICSLVSTCVWKPKTSY